MRDTAKPVKEAQIMVDGGVFKNVTYGHSKRLCLQIEAKDAWDTEHLLCAC